MTEQLPLPLAHRTALGWKDFLVAPNNAEAVAWLNRWPAWPASALLLVGETGSGKSHLAHMFASRTGTPVLAMAPGTLADPSTVLEGCKALVIDDADRSLDEVTLFHLYNMAKERGASLLLTCARPPALWAGLPDLRSRLMAAPLASIGAPDDAVMAAVLIKMFSDRQLRVGGKVIGYLLRHMERSHAAAQLVVDASDRRSLAGKRPITVPLVREVLGAAGKDP